ncbi:ABC transporter ATP-binding protein [Pelagibius litoralis]|uniref:ABC transporter ATP-binding protein n=1 Tax=Pelagibius litoralis TaxID=374515 RepID=A0A967F040_9PROT|nr:ABC transporter ATP-binding protein [Pelagibius litoralis]NIA70568.1 ABC transporter ATP-binding protein [Pelagibius litoralis]
MTEVALLEVRNLCIAVASGGALLPVVEDVSFAVEAGRTLGIVGESGCGKSLTSLAIMGLLEGSQVRITAGEIWFAGRELTRLPAAERRAIMGDQMAMIFQEPMTSLNPVYRIGDQIVEVLRQHRTMSRRAALARAAELLALVRIPAPEERLKSYPHQLSGGMRQRVMIAMAIACDPGLLIADEPTTALDVTVQAQILDLLADLQARTGMAVVLISHDLGVIAETCQTIAVMYRGRVVESASAAGLFAEARHPYTRGLMASIPDADADCETLPAIAGRVPRIDEQIGGCAFHPRCPYAASRCTLETPVTATYPEDHFVLCHFPDEAAP